MCMLTADQARSGFWVLVQLDGDAAALFDPLHTFLPGRWLLVGAVEGEGHGGEALGFAEGAGLEGSPSRRTCLGM